MDTNSSSNITALGSKNSNAAELFEGHLFSLVANIFERFRKKKFTKVHCLRWFLSVKFPVDIESISFVPISFTVRYLAET